MSGWQSDKRWSDRFIPEICRILGEHVVCEPSDVSEDCQRNTDLIVLKMRDVRVACRVRKFEMLKKYGEEFTLRASRPSGAKTELAKVIEGWGDYLFYAFSDEAEVSLAQWIIVDLNKFRLWHSKQLYSLPANSLPGKTTPNKDGSSEFVAFDVIPSLLFERSKKSTQLAGCSPEDF